MRKYSVVIPMYNAANTIALTLQSILDQTYLDHIDEVIIVDDESNDGSAEIVKTFSKDNNMEIKMISITNGGAASARNRGIREARNQWIALLDADDSWMPNKIEIQDKVLDENPSFLSIGSNRINESITRGVSVAPKVYQLTPVEYCVKNWPCTPSLIFNKEIFDGDYYFDEELTHAEEGIFFLDIAHRSGLYYHEDELVLCGNGKRSFGVSGLSGNIKKMHQGVLKMMKEAYKKSYITYGQLLYLSLLERIKYIRRIIVVKTSKS